MRDPFAYEEDEAQIRYRLGEFLGRNGSVAASKRAPEHYLPEVGDIILYNENISQIEPGQGSFGKTPRGIGRVLGYGGCNGCQMWVLSYRRPGCNRRESFLSNDFRMGLFVYRKLTDYIYTADRYDYYDLDIRNPHEDIAKLFADDGNYLVPEEDQMYASAVR